MKVTVLVPKSDSSPLIIVEKKARHPPPFKFVFVMYAVIIAFAVIFGTIILGILYSTAFSQYDEVSVTPSCRHAEDHRPTPAPAPAPARAPAAAAGKVMSCYYNTPSVLPNHQLLPAGINPHLCTHINIAFASVQNKQIKLDQKQNDTIQQVVKLKAINPKLKILLSVGGAGNNDGFSEMVVDHASRKIFIKSLKYTLGNYSLDGVDLDWEFPAVHNNVAGQLQKRERQHFSQLLREIRAEFIREKRDYILTIAAAAPKIIVDTAYDVDQINLYVDFVNVMTYDFHFFTSATPFTGLNSPLYPRKEEKLYFSTLNINATVHMYLGKGLDPNKIVVGIPTYGHTFYLVNSQNTNIGSPASGFGTIGHLGFIDYVEICQYIKDHRGEVTLIHDKDSKVPYMYSLHNWVSFDSPESVMEKAKFIKDNKLRGAMIYSLNADDYLGTCDDKGLGGNTRFPLSHSIRNTLYSHQNNYLVKD